MARVMAWADVSLNAAGSTCWELMCLGVPMVATSLSRDQKRNARALAAAGVAALQTREALAYAGTRVESLLADPDRRGAMSRRAAELVDGLGAERAADSLQFTIESLQEVVDAAA
jgi:spore coat polysaccharide biosynthesis predicted glycosyltransferase SpsG